jgi:hypothetical protein
MASLLEGANTDTQFCVEDADESDDVGEVSYDEEKGTESTVISVGSGSKKRITLNTHALETKNKVHFFRLLSSIYLKFQALQAARLLHDLAGALKGHMRSYLVPSLTVLLSMVTDKHSSDVRSSASLALAK